MKSIFLNIFILFSIIGCKKPETGNYTLKLLFNNGGVYNYNGELIKVKSKSLEFSVARAFYGNLNKDKRKVSGILNVISSTKTSYTINVNGEIAKNGIVTMNNIDGTFTASSDSGNFSLTRNN